MKIDKKNAIVHKNWKSKIGTSRDNNKYLAKYKQK